MFEDFKFEDLKILTQLDSTHKGSTLVHLAKLNDQLVVCKSILKSYLSTDAKKEEHFVNEVECLRIFKDSEHINNLVKVFEDAEKKYLLLRAEKGLPLHKLIQMAGNFQEKMTQVIITQVTWILQEVHNAGVVYRDIKASNFMMDKDGRVTLIDLGLAKKIDKKRTYSICGTVHAMPPEILLQTSKQGYSYEFDYYGLGILIYELTVGQPPYGYHTTNPEIVECVKQGMSSEHFEKVKDPVTRDLIKELLRPAHQRLGSSGGLLEILQHEYFKRMNLQDLKDIYSGHGEQIISKYNFGEHREQVQDFGIDINRYNEICPDDPFFKFG